MQLTYPFSVINDYSLLKIMFGNVTELKDLALPPAEEIKKYKAEETLRKNKREDFKFDSKDIDKLFALIPVDPKERKYAYDILEFNALMESVSKMVMPQRRAWLFPSINTALSNAANYIATQASIFGDAAASYGLVAVTVLSDGGVGVWEYIKTVFQPYGAYDSDYYRLREDSADGINLEYVKLAKLDQIMICLLIHTRYRVDFAIRQRKMYLDEPSRRFQPEHQVKSTSPGYKAYRLGYLFNRLRRVKYMQARAVQSSNIERLAANWIKPAFNVVHENFGWKLVRWYQKMIHLDMDLRDLCQVIYETIDEVSPEPILNPRERQLKG